LKTTLLVMMFTLMGVFNGLGQSQKNNLKLTLAALPLIGSSGDVESGVNGFVIKPSGELNFSFKCKI